MRLPAPARQDRRDSPRLEAVPNAIRLNWPERGAMLRGAGEMLNASATGALLRCDPRPPLDQWLLVRLERPVRTDWYPARVVRHGSGTEVGVKFGRTDPYAFVLAATIGIDMEHALINLPDDQRFSTSCD